MRKILCLLMVAMALVMAGRVMAASTNNLPHFSGKVVGSDGRPIAGATVARYEYPDASLAYNGRNPELKEQVVTQADGSFDLPSSGTPAFFIARKPGLAPAWRQSWNMLNGLTNQQIVLAAPVSLAGVVVDDHDKPVADVEVFVQTAVTEVLMPGGARTFSFLMSKQARELFSARTGADGRFQIDGFPAEAGVNLAIQAPGKVLRRSGTEPMEPGSMPWRSGDKAAKLIVEPAGSIEGKIVVQEGGRPLGNVQILWSSEPASFGAMMFEPTRSVADGTFKIANVAAGSYRLRAIFGTNALPDWVAETVLVTVGSGQSVRDVQLAAVKGELLQVGVIAKSDRRPISDAAISVYRQDFQAFTKSGTNGIATLRLLPGDYQVFAVRDNWRADALAASVQAGQSNRVDLELSGPSIIRGIVRRPDGQPAVGAEIRIVGMMGPMDAGTLKTDSSGRFETEWNQRNYGRMDSTPCLLVRMPQNGWAAAQDIDAETGPLELNLAPGLTLVGQVKSSTGQPVTNAMAALIYWTGNSGMYLGGLTIGTNTPGHFEIPALPTGRRYGLSVSAPGFGQKFINQVPADAAGKVELDPVELSVANLKLAGQVLDSEDKPVAGANVNLQGEGQPNDNTRTDREGRFKFDRVCEGPVRIFANARNTFANAAAQGGDTNVILHLGEQQMGMPMGTQSVKITGTVTGPDGKPAIGARVRLFSQMDVNAQWTRVDTNGVYKVTSNRMPRQAGGTWVAARDATGKLSAAAEIAEGVTKMDLQLKAAGAVTGLVHDTEGKPMPRATVNLMMAHNHMQNQWDVDPAHLDAQGQFEIGGLPAGLSFHVYASAPGYGRAHQEFAIEDSPDFKLTVPTLILKRASLPLAGQVVNDDQKPMANAQVQIVGDGQPQAFVTTDRQGRFKLQVCEGPVRLFVNSGENFANSTLEGGETNAVITLSPRSNGFSEQPRRRALQGSPLPDVASLGLAADTLPAGKPGLLILLDFEQRKSKRALRQLSDQIETLKLKGVAVAVVQVKPTGDDIWEALKGSAGADSLAFGRVTAASAKNRWATETKWVPWLILKDKTGRVTSEGFNLDDLEAQLDSISK